MKTTNISKTEHNETKALKPSHVAFYAIWPGNESGPIGHVHKLNLSDLDQSRAISSGAWPFTNYLRAIHYAFVNSGAKQSDYSDLIQVKSAICLHFIRTKYDADK